MSYTTDDLTAVNDCIRDLSTGKAVAEYEIRGRKIKYKDLTLDELQRLRRTIQTSLNMSEGKARPRYGLLTTGKGL